MDVSELKTIFGAKTVYLAACFDAFSRLPLTAMTFERKPGDAAMARLFRKAIGLFQAPNVPRDLPSFRFPLPLYHPGFKLPFAGYPSTAETMGDDLAALVLFQEEAGVVRRGVED